MGAESGGGRPADVQVSPGEFRLAVERDPFDDRDDRYPSPGAADVADLIDPEHRPPDSRDRLRELVEQPPPTFRATRSGDVFVCRDYRELADPAWRQRGLECTGFALAAIANYHLRTDIGPDAWATASPEVRRRHTASRRMLYEMAQVYDQRDFEEGSTMRGALKGWAKHGVASEAMWPYEPGDEYGQVHGSLTIPRALDAVARPGGRYLRIDHSDADAMRDALLRGFPLFASAQTHVGWFDLYLPGRRRIDRDAAEPLLGGHAFVICGFGDDGWLIHNSWGPEWGADGYGIVPYEDFDETGQDVWFIHAPRATTFFDVSERGFGGSGGVAPPEDEWLHRISIADDGGLTRSGRFGMNADEIGTQLYLFRERTQHWRRRRLVIFADGGYFDPATTLERLRPFKEELMLQEIYPLFLVWDSAWMDGLQGWLHGEVETDPNAPPSPSAIVSAIDGTEHSDADRLQDRWRVLGKFSAAQFSAPRVWAQVVRAAADAARPDQGTVAILADRVGYNLTRAPFEVHLVGYGAGELVLGHLASQLPSPIASCNLWAPTTTMARFEQTFGRLLEHDRLHHLAVVALAAAAEEADGTGPLAGSFLRLVADVLEADVDLDTAVRVHDGMLRWTPDAAPLLGLADTLASEEALLAHVGAGRLRTSVIPDGTHAGLATDPRVWDATIDQINAPPSLTDDAWTGGGRSETPPSAAPDPLDWVIRRTAEATAARSRSSRH